MVLHQKKKKKRLHCFIDQGYIQSKMNRHFLSRKKKCRNPGLNQGPLDLQSNALPTELFRLTANLGTNSRLYCGPLRYMNENHTTVCVHLLCGGREGDHSVVTYSVFSVHVLCQFYQSCGAR